MKIMILIIIAVLLLPFYVYILSKTAMLGKIETIKQFVLKEVKNGEENDEDQE